MKKTVIKDATEAWVEYGQAITDKFLVPMGLSMAAGWQEMLSTTPEENVIKFTKWVKKRTEKLKED